MGFIAYLGFILIFWGFFVFLGWDRIPLFLFPDVLFLFPCVRQVDDVS